MIIRIVRMHFQSDKVSEFLDIFYGSQAQISAMPGCHGVELYRDAHNPDVYYTHSRWTSVTDLDAYRASEVFGNVWPRTKKLFAAKPLAYSLMDVADE